MLSETSMQWKKKKFSLCYSYNLMTYFINDIFVGKYASVGLKKNHFLCAVWSKHCWESTGVSEDNWGHLLPNSWFCLGCTWAGGCSSQVCSGVFGDLGPLQGTGWLQPGTGLYRSRKESFSVRGEWNWWICQYVAGPEVGWVAPEVVMILENRLEFFCRGRDSTALKSSSLLVCIRWGWDGLSLPWEIKEVISVLLSNRAVYINMYYMVQLFRLQPSVWHLASALSPEEKQDWK